MPPTFNIEKYKSSKFIFVIGIGGSNAASKAVYHALRDQKFILPKQRMIFIEILSKRYADELKEFIKTEIKSKEDFCIFVISESGKTKETREGFEGVLKILEEKSNDSKERVIAISTKSSPLHDLAKEKGYDFAPWPQNIGGRYSALHAPHVLPLSVAGFDMEEYTKGEDREEIKSLADQIAENYQKGIQILDFFFFEERLEEIGKWGRQLIAESLGKTNADGVKSGIMPTVTIAPKDLHSMLQLYLGGPNSRFTIFIDTDLDTPLENTIKGEVFEAYEKLELPHFIYKMGKVNEKSIGEFFGTMINLTFKLAEFLKVNPSDEPEVEKYKAKNW